MAWAAAMAMGNAPPPFAPRVLKHGGLDVAFAPVQNRIGLVMVTVGAGTSCANKDCQTHASYSLEVGTADAVRFFRAFDDVHILNADILQDLIDAGEGIVGPPGGNVINKNGSEKSWGGGTHRPARTACAGWPTRARPSTTP